MAPNFLPLILASALGGVGCLIIWGFITRRVDSHPLCRRCRYDLVGTAGVPTCPECGADLQHPRAIRIGHRRRAWSFLVIGLVLLLVGGAAGIVEMRTRWGAMGPGDMPTWWLVRETRSKDPAVVGPVLRELLARYEAGTLSPKTVRALAAQGLAYRDSNAPCGMWNCEYGNFLDIAWQDDLLSQAQRDAYVRGAFSLWWSGPRLRTFEGAPTNPMLVVLVSDFLGNPFRSIAAPPPIDFELVELSVSLSGEPADVHVFQRAGGFDPERGMFQVSRVSAVVELPMHPEGLEVKLRWCLQTVDMRSREPLGEPWAGSRVFILHDRVEGSIRPHDDRRPPDISRY